MEKIIKLFFLSLFLLLLASCNSELTTDEIFQFKDSFVGDNSAVVNITNQLASAEFLSSIELHTNEEPYGIILNYRGIDSELNDKETVITNATFIFTLVQNVDWITFNIDKNEITITKANLQEMFDVQFSEIQSEEEIIDLLQDLINDRTKVNQLFKD